MKTMFRLTISGADPRFNGRGFDNWTAEGGTLYWGPGHPSAENFKIQVLGNAISDVLRPSHGVSFFVCIQA